MTIPRIALALAALIGASFFAALATSGPAAAHGWYHHRYHHHPYGYSYMYRGGPDCWREWRTVRVHTRHGWRWRERLVTICR